MNAPFKTQPAWSLVAGMLYTLTDDDFEDGRNKLGMSIERFTLNVPLCGGCDLPVPASGYCENCRIIHTDIGEAT